MYIYTQYRYRTNHIDLNKDLKRENAFFLVRFQFQKQSFFFAWRAGINFDQTQKPEKKMQGQREPFFLLLVFCGFNAFPWQRPNIARARRLADYTPPKGVASLGRYAWPLFDSFFGMKVKSKRRTTQQNTVKRILKGQG